MSASKFPKIGLSQTTARSMWDREDEMSSVAVVTTLLTATSRSLSYQQSSDFCGRPPLHVKLPRQ